MVFLREKNEGDKAFREKELAFKVNQQEIDFKRHEALIAQQSAGQSLHNDMLQLMREANKQQQQQAQNTQMMMMQLQQQQTQAMMTLMEKLTNKM